MNSAPDILGVLHDATVQSLTVDWLAQSALFQMAVESPEGEAQPVVMRIDGLLYCAMQAPEVDPGRGYEAMPERGLWIDAGEGPGHAGLASSLPRTPAGYTLLWMYVRQWNRFIHVCGRDVSLEWGAHVLPSGS